MTAKNMPYKHGFGPFAAEVYRAPLSYPFRDAGVDGAGGRAPRHRPDREAGRRRQPGRRRHRADPGRGRVHRARRRASSRRSSSGAAPTASSSSPTRCRPASPAPGDLFACEHEGVVPDLIVTAKGIAGGLPLAAVTGRAEIMDAPHVGGLGGTYGGNPLACAAALAVIETIEADGLVERARPDREDDARAAGRAPGSATRASATCAAAARWWRSSWSSRAPRAGPRADRRRSRRRRTRRAWWCSPAAPTATCCASCRRSQHPGPPARRGARRPRRRLRGRP